ncbi:MAG: FKBP-type peptidyl-prolyl cis-trans isomerase SlyD, partial [Flavobacteriales bacterium]
MKIENGSTVTLTYSLRVEGFDGEVWEQIPNEDPMVIVVGKGEVLEKFEKSLVGQEKGDKFQVMISCDDAYGPEDPEAIFELPKDSV